MNELFYIISQFILLFLFLFLLIFFLYSIFEKEKGAATKTIPVLILLVILGIVNFMGWVSLIVQEVFVISAVTGSLLVIIPYGNKKISFKIKANKYDERDIMFSRMELKEGTQKFNDYYKNQPQNKTKDDLFRKEPGLLNPNSKFYNPLLFNAAAATFSTVDLLQPLVEKNHVQKQCNINSAELSEFLKNWSKKLGASDIGFTLLKPHHIYSHIGRGNSYGEKVKLNHKFAIAFTVEMNHESLRYTPKGPIIMESAQQYLNAGTIAVQLAQFIRNMGFNARAHIDANYSLICPIVAQDAGLGTIGRMGLLMTPKTGPRVRIGVVSTDLELDVNQKPLDSTVIQFCEICKKCTVNCPSNAIPSFSGKKEENWKPWKINHEKCFTYWCKVGTDCGRCITVCPYSHPNNFLHNSIRWMIKQNNVNRWLALKLDNYFYGDKPSITPLKNWMGF